MFGIQRHCLVMAACISVLSACVWSGGYTSAERLSIDCSLSPIQSSFASTAGRDGGKCRRHTDTNVMLAATDHYRYFSFGSGYAEVVYEKMGYLTYTPHKPIGAVVGRFASVREKAFDFGEAGTLTVAGETYETIGFKRGKRISCFGFSHFGDAFASGYDDHLYGYVCLRRPEMTEGDLEAFLDGLAIVNRS